MRGYALIRAGVPIKFSEITSGMYLGTTASKQPDGTLAAIDPSEKWAAPFIAVNKNAVTMVRAIKE